VFGLPLTLVGRFGIQVQSFLVEPFKGVGEPASAEEAAEGGTPK